MTVQQALEDYQRVFGHGLDITRLLERGVVSVKRLEVYRARKNALLATMTGKRGNSIDLAASICEEQLPHVDSWQVDNATGHVFCVHCVVARAARQTVKGTAKV